MLDDNEVSLNQAMNLVEHFVSYSGLRANFDKTQAVRVEARRGCGVEYKTNKPIL